MSKPSTSLSTTSSPPGGGGSSDGGARRVGLFDLVDDVDLDEPDWLIIAST